MTVSIVSVAQISSRLQPTAHGYSMCLDRSVQQERLIERRLRLFVSSQIVELRCNIKLHTRDGSPISGPRDVDLNQSRAGMADSLEDSRHSAIRQRILAAQERETRASYDDVHTREPDVRGDFSLVQAYSLFADCYLAPIATKGPLLTTDALRQAQQRQRLASGGTRRGTAAAAVLAPPRFGCLVPGGVIVRVPAVCAHTTFESEFSEFFLICPPRRDFPVIITNMNSQQLASLVREQAIDVFGRMFCAVELVQERLNRACGALRRANVPYAVIGGNAVAAWVATIDDGAVRNTRDVDLLLAEEDMPRATEALQAVGFIRDVVMDTIVFLDGPKGKPSQGLHILIAGRKVKPEYASPTPKVEQAVEINEKRIVELESLVEMKLNSYRDKDRTHLRDMIQIGLIDATWPDRFPPQLGQRLQALLDDPEG